MFSYSALDNLKSYVIHSATVTEVEVDVLTGEQLVRIINQLHFASKRENKLALFQIRRVDILEDVGQSISPLIDIGQIEGAFLMGVGWWTTEKVTVTSFLNNK